MIVSPPPDLCTDWTYEQGIDYEAMVEAGIYPAVAELVTSWNESCTENAKLLGREWLPPPAMQPAPKKPWWRFW